MIGQPARDRPLWWRQDIEITPRRRGRPLPLSHCSNLIWSIARMAAPSLEARGLIFIPFVPPHSESCARYIVTLRTSFDFVVVFGGWSSFVSGCSRLLFSGASSDRGHLLLRPWLVRGLRLLLCSSRRRRHHPLGPTKRRQQFARCQRASSPSRSIVGDASRSLPTQF